MADEPAKETPSKPPGGTQYRYIGYHMQDLSHGAVIAPGEFIEDLDTDDEFNKRLVDDGLFIQVGG